MIGALPVRARTIQHGKLEIPGGQREPLEGHAIRGSGTPDMNDGIYLPFAEERFAKFRDGMIRLHDAVIRSGARIIHVTPPIFDERRGKRPGYAAVLDRYAEWLVAQRAAGWTVIDLHTPMQMALDERRRAAPSFFFARDGVHPDAAGHWVMARAILAGLR